ncbi:hypothetical protein COV19_06905 [Candidatus Woesearchaeota archaeon CG10_big_fil_rev_8_21_14_0_10_44_13]|nr:MAG: hypothetical protein COV19_06905 [Candidatus Woesearchaeota archaeon CG10_big_fil_rev_8_21_14_0_10_44_13]
MILKNIKLSNIRSYRSQSIDFPDGSLLLSGDIGAGKSTILLAAEFALFGIMKGDLSGENLLRYGSDEGSVELKFDVDGKEVIIKRNLKRAKDSTKQESGFIIVDGKKDDGTHIELKARILDLLGYPKELVSKSKSLVYRYTVYTPQEQMKHIIFSDREERLNILRGVFGIDRYKRVVENTSIILKTMKERSKELEGRVFGIEEKNRQLIFQKTELEKAGKRLGEIRPKLCSAAKLVEDRNRLLAEKEKGMENLRQLKKELEISSMKLNDKVSLSEKNRKEQEILEKQAFETSERISGLDVRTARSLERIEQSIKENDARIKSILQQRSGFSESKKHLERRVKELEKSIEESAEHSMNLELKEKELLELKKKTEAKDRLKRYAEELEHGINDISKKLNELEALRKNSESIMKNILSMQTCPMCTRPVEKEHKHDITAREQENIRRSLESAKLLENQLNEKKEGLKDIKKSIEEVFESEKRAEKLGAEAGSLKKTLDGMAEKKKELARSEQELVSSTEKLLALQKEDVDKISRELEDEKSLLKRLQEKNHLEEILGEKEARKKELVMMQEEIKKDIGDINNARIMLYDKLKAAGDAETSYLNAKKGCDEAKENMKLLQIEEKGIATQEDGISGMIKILEKEINEKLLAKQRLERTRQVQDWLENQFLNVVAVIEKNVMYKIQAQFRELFQQWFKALVEDEALMVSLDESFTPIVQQDGYEASLDGLSGGEKTAVALAYRLSLNKVINSIVGTIKTKDLIILDEPTDGFSSEQLDKVRDVIEDLGMKQVIIVSHEPKVESFVNTVLRIGKSGHVSSVGG